MGLSAREMMAVQVSERFMSVLSILGSLFIISTFLKWHYFRKPINRLVFYASFGNILTNVATLVSTSALPGYSGGYGSLCEFQGIMIQWFMMADTLWVFSMALNVMLVFFHGYDSRSLLRLEKWYLLLCYGLPGTIAIIYIIMNHFGRYRMKIIGPATIWCWVGKDVEWLRLAFFYGPIWVVIGATMVIYVAVGYRIFKKRAELRSFTEIPDFEQDKTLANPFTAKDFWRIRVETELKVETTYTVTSTDRESVAADAPSRNSMSSTKELSESVDARTKSPSPLPGTFASIMPAHEEIGPAGYNATAFSTPEPQKRPNTHSQSFSIATTPTKRRNAVLEGNAAAWGYLKVAFLMWAALFVVWVPSTINRMVQFADKNQAVFGLNLASALVLPLQGFWNAMIYISTTWPESKRALAEILNAISNFRQARKRKSATKKGPLISDLDGIHRLDPVLPKDSVNSRHESQRHLRSMSSAETLRQATSASGS